MGSNRPVALALRLREIAGWPGQKGQTSPAALSHTVMTKSMCGASAVANSSQVLLRRPSVEIPTDSSVFSARGLDCWFSRGLLPAENALKRPWPMWLRMASARMLRAELWVHKNKTLTGFSSLGESLWLVGSLKNNHY